MPFALIPEGFELIKVTKAQEQAVSKYYNQQRINSLLENPAIPLAVSAASLTGVAGLKLKDYLVSLQLNEKVDDFIDNTTDKVKDIIVDPFVLDPSEKSKFISDFQKCLEKHKGLKNNAITRLAFGPRVTACMIGKGYTSEIIGEALSKYI